MRRIVRGSPVLGLVALASGGLVGGTTACGGPDSLPAPATDTAAPSTGGTGDDTGAPVAAPIDDLVLLARLSLDLRGVRPSVDEIASVQADPSAVDSYAQAWVDDPRFAPRMAWLYNDTVHTAVWGAGSTRWDGWETHEWQAIGQEPLQLVQAIVADDRPFSDLVTSGHVYANPTLAELWSLPYAGEASEWAPTSYSDDRPMAGMLSMNTFWMRYTADALNLNRARANAVAGILLCADFLKREGSFTFAASADALASIEYAVATEPACVTCHSALDPLASFFAGFAERSVNLPPDQFLRYSQLNADWAATRRSPAYYGVPGADVADVGAMIAEDPRFSSCAAQRFEEALVGSALEDRHTLEALADQFRADGLRIRPLALNIVASDRYRDPERRMLQTEQLHSSLADLLGWDVDGGDLDEGLNALSWSPEHRVMGGGTDDDTVLQRNRVPGLGHQALAEWTARQAAGPAIDADLARDLPDRILVTTADGELPATDADARTLLAQWHTRFLTAPVDVDAPSVDRLVTAWQDAGGADAGRTAWVEVLGLMIRHPALVVY